MTERKQPVAQRRFAGGARREASERVTLSTSAFETVGWTLNVSRGGLRLIVEDSVEVGGVYQVAFGTSEQPRDGRVVWVRDEADGQIAGIEFLDAQGSVPPRQWDSEDE